MITLAKLISDIRNRADSGENNYSFRISDEQTADWIHEIRGMLISQAISKRQDITDAWVQSIRCLPLQQVDEADCCDITTGCYLLRSINKIPRTIETWMDNTILRVTTANGNIIPKSDAFEVKYTKYNKYTAQQSQWYISNDYLYITNTELLDKVNIFAIFENPEDLATFTNCTGDSCFSWEDPYPVSFKMASDISNIILQTKAIPFLSMPQDTTNNAYSDNQPGIKK